MKTGFGISLLFLIISLNQNPAFASEPGAPPIPAPKTTLDIHNVCPVCSTNSPSPTPSYSPSPSPSYSPSPSPSYSPYPTSTPTPSPYPSGYPSSSISPDNSFETFSFTQNLTGSLYKLWHFLIPDACAEDSPESCSTNPGTPRPPAPFTFTGIQWTVVPVLLDFFIEIDDGQVLLEKYCTATPPGVTPPYWAFTFWHKLKDTDVTKFNANLYIEVGKKCDDEEPEGKDIYRWNDIYLAGPPEDLNTYKLDPAKIILWNSFSPEEREKVKNYLLTFETEERTEKRMAYLDARYDYQLYHEKEHADHMYGWFKALEYIVNHTPGYLPLKITVAEGASEEDVKTAIRNCADKVYIDGIIELNKRNDECLSDFHEYVYGDGTLEGATYDKAILNCGCKGLDEWCQMEPPYQPESFDCDYSDAIMTVLEGITCE